MRTVPMLAIAAAAISLAACATVNEGSVRSSGQDMDSTPAWSALDSNSDGALSVDEIEQQHAMGLLQDLRAADGNDDRAISKAEFDAWWPRMTNHFVRSGEAAPAFESAR